jgi:hypothetical protein
MREILFRKKKNIKNWTGVIIGKISVGSLVRIDSNGDRVYECKCECGKRYEMSAGNLNRSKGIGCVDCKNKSMRDSKFRHGESDTRLHTIWQHMRARCFKQKQSDYKNYGERGITVCDEWLVYENFRDWSLQNGYDEKLSIDRKDVNGNYEPSNCRWATAKVQNNNRRNNTIYILNGESKTISQWCDFHGIKYHTVKERLKRHIPIELALTLPLSKPFGFKKLLK